MACSVKSSHTCCEIYAEVLYVLSSLGITAFSKPVWTLYKSVIAMRKLPDTSGGDTSTDAHYSSSMKPNAIKLRSHKRS